MRALENQDHCLELDDEINYYFCKKEASSVGIEPTTSRLTVERANRLRHEDLMNFLYQT